jgi:thioester reductase-like protein
MPTVFFTGYPGFLGSELLPRVLDRSEDTSAVCLVQPKFADLARARRDQLVDAHPSYDGRIRLVEGDITRAGLGLEAPDELQREVTEIFHLAAVYDLAVPRDLGMRVNVDGTRNMLHFAGACQGLERFQYVSTCYVSGRYAGAFTEDDLVKGQSFNNYYEETKFLAEVKVREWMEKGLPATVYRPSIVVGDSRTGATQKYDGPYYVIRWILKQPGVAVMPVVGDIRRTRVNVVPRDFVIAAIAHLSGVGASAGRVYQLADPDPPTVDQMLDAVARAADKRVVRIPTLVGVAKASLDYVPFLERVMGIPSEAIDYFTHPTYYVTEHTLEDLEGTGIEVPPLQSYLERLVAFVRAHPEIRSEAMA